MVRVGLRVMVRAWVLLLGLGFGFGLRVIVWVWVRVGLRVGVFTVYVRFRN